MGIQSKKDPAHVMTEVYKAMQALRCTWKQINNYRVICKWENFIDSSVPNAFQVMSHLSAFVSVMLLSVLVAVEI